MKLRLAVGLFFLLLSATGLWSQDFFLGGIQVNEPDHDAWATALKARQMNTASITVYAKQGDWDSDNIWWEDEESAVMAEIVAAKHAGLHVVLILRVALDHAYDKNRFLWHGMIMPKTNELLTSWFQKYTEFVLKWAKIAEKEGIEMLGVGSELNALSATLPASTKVLRKASRNWYLYHRLYGRRLLHFKDEIHEKHLWVRGSDNYGDLKSFLKAKFKANNAWGREIYFRESRDRAARLNDRRAKLNGHWKKLIADVRKVYGASLTYAANFDNYMEVGFWDALDVIGVNAYFPLQDAPSNAPAAQLGGQFEARWDIVLERLQSFRQEQGLQTPVMFTEIGYTFRRNCAVEPWAHAEFSLIRYDGKDRLVVWQEQQINYEERKIAIRAFVRALEKQDNLPFQGMLFWKLSTDLRHREIEPFVLCIGTDSEDPLLEILEEIAKGMAIKKNEE